MPHEGARVGVEVEQTPRPDALRLPFQGERFDSFGGDLIVNELIRRVSQEDLTRLREFLETRSDVHRVTGYERLATTGDNLAGIDSGARVDPHGIVPLEL